MSGSQDDPQSDVERIDSALEELREIAGLPADALDSFFDDTIGVLFPERRHDYRTFWERAKEIPNLFKSSRLSTYDRKRLWARYQSLCTNVKELRNRERETKLSNSSRNAEEIRPIIHDAHNWAVSAENPAHLQQARMLLRQALEKIKEKFLLKDHRNELWASWKEANDELGVRYSVLRDNNYDRIRDEISAVSSVAVDGDPYEALARMKEIQKDIHDAFVSKDQRRWLREGVEEWWDKAIARIEERKAERAQKRDEWQSRMEAKLDRLSDLREKNATIIERLREQIDDLEGKIDSSWNENWAEQARGWVQEKYEKIRDIEQTNDELEEKIREIKNRLAE